MAAEEADAGEDVEEVPLVVPLAEASVVLEALAAHLVAVEDVLVALAAEALVVAVPEEASAVVVVPAAAVDPEAAVLVEDN